MLRITTVENDNKRQLVLEGKLVAPWTDELKAFSHYITADRDPREVVIDLRGVTAISAEGEDVLLALMDEGAKFRVSGVYMRHVVKNLFRRSRTAKEISGKQEA